VARAAAHSAKLLFYAAFCREPLRVFFFWVPLAAAPVPLACVTLFLLRPVLDAADFFAGLLVRALSAREVD